MRAIINKKELEILYVIQNKNALEVAKIYGVSYGTIYRYLKIYGIKTNRHGRYSVEDLEKIKECVGKYSFPTISKKIGKKHTAVERKIEKMKLGPVKNVGDFLIANELAKILKVSHTTIGRWIVKRDLKAKKKILKCKQKYWVIYITDFWKWAYENKENFDFTVIEKNVLGKEPEWLSKKRVSVTNKVKKGSYSKAEDEKLIMYVKMGLSSKVIALRMNRKEESIEYRRSVLFKEQSTYTFWTAEQDEKLLKMKTEGYSNRAIGDVLMKTPKAVSHRSSFLAKKLNI